MLGRCYQVLGDYENAGARYEQALLNEPLDQSEPAKLTIPETHYRLSQVLFDGRKNWEAAFKEADTAVKAHPNSPNYLEARARALVQLKRFKEADRDLHDAIVLDPNHRASLLLHKLVESELHKGKPTANPQ